MGCIPPLVSLWHAKKAIIYAWIVHRWVVYCELAQPYAMDEQIILIHFGKIYCGWVKFSVREILLCIFRMIYNFTIALTTIFFAISEVKSNKSNPDYSCSYFFHIFVSNWSNGLVLRTLNSKSRGLVFKTTEWLQGWLSFSFFWGHSNEDQELMTGAWW